MPHLIDLQRKSYEWFINEGLNEIFHDISPIKDFNGNLELSFESFELGEPKYTIEECKERDASYCAPLNVNVRLVYKDTGEIKESHVFMGDFPLMTSTGTFVINGAERVIVSQLVRSPGAYYDKQMDPSAIYLYGTQVIPNRGAWIEFETDLNHVIYARVDRTRKVPATVLLRVMGLETNEDILNFFGDTQIESHVDDLMNYIRYWQASGESLKTSIRTKTRLSQLTEQGYYTGGTAPYGYRAVNKGRVNKKNKPVFDLEINEEEADIVRLIFQKYVYEGYGSYRLCHWLDEHNITRADGKGFPNTTIQRIIQNIAYTGVIKNGDAWR